MISFCITGLSHSAIAAAERALVAAGMAAACPVQRETSITFASWHTRVQEAIAQNATDPIPEGAPTPIGRLWEQLARDLFLSNMQEPVWGWADTKSLDLLDYWLGFDPSTHFVLLATSPEQMLTEHLMHLSRDLEPTAPALIMDSLMAQWHAAHHVMLRFALRNPKRCILVQADEMTLPSLVQSVQAAWPRQLGALRSDFVASMETAGAAIGGTAHHLLRHFSKEMCAGYPQMQALKNEVDSVALVLSEATSSDARGPVLASVLATVKLADQVPLLTEQIAKLRAELEFEASRGASALLQHQSQAQAQLLASEESFEKELAAYALAAQRQEALLAQLEHDLQNERRINALLTSQLDEELSKNTAALVLIESASAQIAQERQEKLDALAQCELETKAKFALAVQRDALAVSGGALDAKSNSLETLLRSVEEENTLMLAQLSQVQRELERYFLRNKEIGSDADQWALRFRRVLSRQADGIDWESSRAELTQGTDGAQLRCYASQVAVVGKVWAALEFTARIDAGAMVYTFDRRSDLEAVFTRWPRSVAKATQLTVTDGLSSASEDGVGLFREISTSDWDLLCALPKLLGHALGQLKGPWPKGMPRLQAWQKAANATAHALHRQPMALRFDATRLQASKVLTDREYLLLRVDQLSLANRRFASFEFRFGCSLGKGGEFAQNARLEFVKDNTEAAFETWVSNVRDVEGERLDLVFVFPTSMNLKDWTALSINDRGLVLLLADQLPTMLGALVLDNASLVRPLAQWIDLAERLRIFVRTRLDVTGVQQAIPDAVTSNLQRLSGKSVKSRPGNRKIKVRSKEVSAKALPKKSARVARTKMV